MLFQANLLIFRFIPVRCNESKTVRSFFEKLIYYSVIDPL